MREDWELLVDEWQGVQMKFHPSVSCCEGQEPSAVLVMVLHEGRVLLAEIAGRGWCIPSGRLEPGETAEEAARREVYEETGAVIGALHRIGCYSFADGRCALLFRASLHSWGARPADSESCGVRWASLEELPELYYHWSPLMEAVFRYAIETAKAVATTS